MFDDASLLPADPDALAALGRQVGGADLAAPPVVLPTSTTSRKMELPVQRRGRDHGDDPARPDQLVGQLRDGADRGGLRGARRPRGRALHAGGAGALPLPDPRPARPDRAEVVRAAADGAEFGVERWDAPPEDLERIEEGGRLDLERYGGIDRLVAELPGLAWQLARFRFGTVGPSNHFVELQRVEEVLDPERAAALGVREGQLTIQYHGGGGVLTGEIGRLFFRRKDYPRQIRAVNAALKPWFHLRSARSYAQLRQRLQPLLHRRLPAARARPATRASG